MARSRENIQVKNRTENGGNRMSFLPTPVEWVLAGLVGAISCAAPLARTLGYESAMIMTILAGGIALRRGLIEGGQLRRTLQQGADSQRRPVHAFRLASEGFCRATSPALIAAALPYVSIVTSTRLIQGCRVAPGTVLVLFLVLPVAPHLAALGMIVGAAARSTWAAAAILATLAALHVVHPAVQALAGRTIPHSMLFGFLSASAWGGIGSTDLDLPLSYFLLRGLAVAVCPLLTSLAAISALGWIRSGRIRSLGIRLALSAAPAAVAVVYPSAFGLTSGVGVRERALSGRTRTEHVTVRFTPGGRAAATSGALAADADWDFQLVSALMELKGPDPVTVWVYEDEEQMRSLTGAEDFAFALPWRREVHTLRSPRGAEALRHELVHVLAGDWAARQPLRICWNQAMIEGTAEAIASYKFLGGPFQKPAAAALAAGRLTDATTLFRLTGFVWGQTSLRNSYDLSASFIGFLLEKYGPDPLSLAYGGSTWEGAYGKGLSALNAEWRLRIARIPVSKEESEKARATFDPRSNPPFFRKKCPRVGLAAPAAPGPPAPSRATGSLAPAPSGREVGRAPGPADASARSRQPLEEVHSAALALFRTGRPDEAIDLLRRYLAEDAIAGAQHLEISRSLFLCLLAAHRSDEARDLLLKMRTRSEFSPYQTQLYEMIHDSPARAEIASVMLLGIGPGSTGGGRALLRRVLEGDRAGPAALIAANLCSWPPTGTDGAAVRLYSSFLKGGQSAHRGEPTAKAALRLAEHLLRQDKRDEARGFFARVLAETADPWWRVEAAEGLARATGVTAEQFVRSELPKIQSASRSSEAR